MNKPGLTCQIFDFRYKTKITPIKSKSKKIIKVNSQLPFLDPMLTITF